MALATRDAEPPGLGTGRRLRLAAGLTLLALALLTLGVGTINMNHSPDPTGWVAFFGGLLFVVIGLPTLLAAIAVLLGGTRSGVFGGAVSLLFAGLSGILTIGEAVEVQVTDSGRVETWDFGGPVLVAAAIAVAYAFAGIAALRTRHARDKPQVSQAR